MYERKNKMEVYYESIPEGIDLTTKFNTYILAFCPDTDSWFATNERFFFYEYPKEFDSEVEAIQFFKQNPQLFLDVENRIMKVFQPKFCFSGFYLENTSEFIKV